METKTSSVVLNQQLAVRLGSRFYLASSSSVNLAGGFALLVKEGFDFVVFEESDRLLAVKFCKLHGNLSKWLLFCTHSTPYYI